MEMIESYVRYMEHYIDQLTYLPLLLLIESILITYTWSLLNKRVYLSIIFVTGFVILSALFGSILKKLLPADVSDMMIILAGGLAGGLFSLGIFFLFDTVNKVLTFGAGAVLPNLLLVNLGFSISTKEFQPYVLLVVAIVGLLGGIAMIIFSRTLVCQIIGSAVGGALGISYLLMWSGGYSNNEILNAIDSGIKVLKNIKNADQGILVIGVALSGVIVQSLLQIALKKLKKSFAEISKSPNQKQIQPS